MSVKVKSTFLPRSALNILLLGVYERRGEAGRSDTTLVITLNTDSNQATVLSIPRDTRVKIKQHSWDKINHAYAFGGKTLAKETVENFLGIPIDHTIVVNFIGFKKIVEAVSKVELTVEKRMYYCDPNDDNGGLTIDLQSGLQSLDGDTAIQYVRYRDEKEILAGSQAAGAAFAGAG